MDNNKKIPIKECNHRRLSFGSGAFYIFCYDCGHSWVCAVRGEPQGGHHCENTECSQRPNPPPIIAQ